MEEITDSSPIFCIFAAESVKLVVFSIICLAVYQKIVVPLQRIYKTRRNETDYDVISGDVVFLLFVRQQGES